MANERKFSVKKKNEQQMQHNETSFCHSKLTMTRKNASKNFNIHYLQGGDSQRKYYQRKTAMTVSMF